jgi:hypothetical protein
MVAGEAITMCGLLLLSDDKSVGILPQVKYLMGLKIPRFDRLQDTCRSLVANLNYFNWREYVVSRPRSTRLQIVSSLHACTIVSTDGLVINSL